MQTKQFSFQWYHFAVLGLAVFAFFMAGLISERVFERVPHLEDELAYLYQARIFAGGQIVIESPQPRPAYWFPFVIDSNTTGYRFGKYTPGWPAILALGVLMGQIWALNGFLAALTVVLVYRLGKDIFSLEVGLIAALLTAFSPAALLLNASLMSHTAGLFLTTLFIYAYWRMEKGRRTLLWGTIAGLALGASAATRPLTTVSIGLPFVAWSGVRLLLSFFKENPKESFFAAFWKTLKPLLVLAVCTLILAGSIPAFSYIATGDAEQNLYEMVWDYDRVGFGEGYGRNTHRLLKAFAHARFDLSLTAADLFGWQFESIGEEEIQHLRNDSDYYPAKGYSFVLLPIGVLVGLFAYNEAYWKRRLGWLISWAVLALLMVLVPNELMNSGSTWLPFLANFGLKPSLVDSPIFSWIWVILALLWLYFPLLLLAREKPQQIYTWLFLTIVLGIVVVQMTYWIGSQRYSTRYYYEALTAAAFLTALPLAWLAQKLGRQLILTASLLFATFTLFFYSIPRLDALYHLHDIRGDLIAEVEASRVDERPILVIVNGPSSGDARVRWVSYAALSAVSSPYLDSDIIAVRDLGGMREQVIADYPDRQIIELDAEGNFAVIRETNP